MQRLATLAPFLSLLPLLWPLILVPAQGLTAVGFEDGIFPELVQSSRALAMGNAFIARVDDESAPFYNPAGLGTVKRPIFYLSNLLFEINKGHAQEITAELKDSTDRIKSSFDLDGLRKLHQLDHGHFTHNQFSMAPNFTMRYLSFGYFYTRKTRTFYGGGSDDQFEFADRTDHGPYVGGNLSFFGGIIKVGLAAVWVNRREVMGEADVNSDFAPSPEQKSKGSMILQTAGGRLTLPIATLPSIAATLYNSSAKEFTPDKDHAPTAIKQNLVLGFSVTPRIGRDNRLHIEVNYKDFNKKNDKIKSSDRWTLGMEFNFFRTLFLRFGHHGGFTSGGVGIRVQHFRFNFSTYARRKDSVRFPKEEDRRFVLSSSFSF